MSYYAAGGYYPGGGFSFRKLVRAVGKATSFVSKQPILSGLVGLVPGGATMLSGASAVAGLASSASAGHAVRTSTAGNPGANAAMMQAGPVTKGGRKRRPRRRRVWVYGG